LRALLRRSEGESIELEKDGTLAAPVPASTAVFIDGGAQSKIIQCASSRGSFDTQFTAADLDKLGVLKGGAFNVTAHGKSVSVRYGSTYFEVPKGNWIAFIVAETGFLRIGRNYADAVTELGCAAGDTLTITKPASN
jgi:S-adenosylmethionine hydrolase